MTTTSVLRELAPSLRLALISRRIIIHLLEDHLDEAGPAHHIELLLARHARARLGGREHEQRLHQVPLADAPDRLGRLRRSAQWAVLALAEGAWRRCGLSDHEGACKKTVSAHTNNSPTSSISCFTCAYLGNGDSAVFVSVVVNLARGSFLQKFTQQIRVNII